VALAETTLTPPYFDAKALRASLPIVFEKAFMTAPQTRLLTKATIAIFVAVLVFARQIGFFLVEENRYFYLWQWQDALAMFLDVAILAIVVLAGSVVLRALGWDRLRRVYNHLFLVVLAGAGMTLLPDRTQKYLGVNSPDSFKLNLIWLAIAFVVGFSLGYPRSRLVEIGKGFCLVFSPIILILAYQSATTATWSTAAETDPQISPPIPSETKAATPQTPIFIFVFDEWSYDRTTHDGRFDPEFVNMQALGDESFNFRQAWSFSSRSMHSLPALIYQNDKRIEIGAGLTFWKETKDKPSVPTPQVPSIFSQPKDLKYFTALQGIYLPYKRILGDQLDYCRSQVVLPKGDRLLERMAITAIRNMSWWTDRLTWGVRGRLEAKLQSERWYVLSNRLLDESLRLIDRSPKGTIAFFHWSLPHGPFVFNPDGSYHGQYPRGGMLAGLGGASVEDYRRHLLYQDVVIGRLIEHLKASGKYDEALLIFTSDHSWRPDPLYPEPNWKIDPARRRVPLLVKFPGQKQGQVIDKTIYNNIHLKTFISHALLGTASAERMAKVIRELKDVPTPTGMTTVLPEDSEGDSHLLEGVENGD
jgi:sulfatase-like protein